jgi:ATP-binding protein involved in chromosome partitioning
LDLDLYGPSIPLMLGLTGKQAQGVGDKIGPLTAHGLKVLSIGFLIPADAALIWRGPMAAKAVKQLLHDVAWGELDVLILDLPPGTGDIQISLVSETPIAGAVVVATPQEVALADVIKAVKMFQQVDAPIMGVVENMSYMLCRDCGARQEIFGHGTVEPLAAKLGVDFLGEIPLDPDVPSLADHGQSVLTKAPVSGEAYRSLAAKVRKFLDARLSGKR